jgi:hypothetical protein
MNQFYSSFECFETIECKNNDVADGNLLNEFNEFFPLPK